MPSPARVFGFRGGGGAFIGGDRGNFRNNSGAVWGVSWVQLACSITWRGMVNEMDVGPSNVGPVSRGNLGMREKAREEVVGTRSFRVVLD